MNPTDQTAVLNVLNVELSEAMAEGEYDNLAMIAHRNSEFRKGVK